MAKPIVYEIVGGTYQDAQDKTKTLSTFLVDPNPADGDTHLQEDLFAYLELVAKPKSRSIIQSQNSTDAEFLSTGEYSKPVSFTTSTRQNGKDYHTTNFMNIDGTQSHVEGFGITSVSIDVGADYTPKVVIEFFDTKSGSFNDFENKGGSVFSDNPMGMFFRLPYPVFELTIKGFYGRAVTYCLNLMKWTANFNPDAGGFIIKAEFIGYTFAFLADIPFKHVWAISQTPQGRDKISAKGIIPLCDMLSGFGKLTRISEDIKSSNGSFLKLKYVNLAISKLVTIINLVGVKTSEANNSIFTAPIVADIGDKEQVFIRDVGVIGFNKVNEYSVFVSKVYSLIQEYNSIIENNVQSNLSLQQYELPQLIHYHGSSEVVANLKPIVGENYPDFDIDTITEESIGTKYPLNTVTTGAPYYHYLVNYKKIRDTLSDLLGKLTSFKKTQETETIAELNTIAVEKLGFVPTVENVFEVLCGNIDAYLEVLYDYSMKAASDALVGERSQNLSNFITDIDVDTSGGAFSNRIHPFPDVISTEGEKIWIGDSSIINNKAFPEVELVNLVINGINKVYTEERNKNYLDSLRYTIENDVDTHFPMNVLDYGDSPYEDTNFSSGILSDDFVNAVLNNFFALYSAGNITELSYLLSLAKIDGQNLHSNIINPTVGMAINGATDFASGVIDYAVTNGIIDSGVGYTKPSIGVNGTDLTSQSVLLGSQNPDILTQIISNSVLPNTAIDDYIRLVTPDKKFNNIFDKKYNPQFDKNYILSKDYTIGCFESPYGDRIVNDINGNPNLSIAPDTVNSEINYDFIAIKNVRDLSFVFGKTSNTGNPVIDTGVEGQSPFIDPSLNFYFLTLRDLQFKRDLSEFFDQLRSYSGIMYVPRLFLSYVGGYFYFLNPANDSLHLVEDMELNQSVTSELQNVFIDYFKTLSQESLQADIRTYYYLKQKNIGSTSDAQYELLRVVYQSLFTQITKTESIIIVNASNISQSVPGVSQGILSQYLTTLHQEYQRLYNESPKPKVEIDDAIIRDADFKLDTYDSLKAIYDKWLSYGDGKIYNNCFYGNIRNQDDTNETNDSERQPQGNINQRDRKLMDLFHFVDRTWSDIGDKAVINPKILMNLSSNDNETMYGFISKLLNDSKFLVYFAPSFTANRTAKDLEMMFTPQPTLSTAANGASVIAIYTGGNSKYLAIPKSQYKDDGFNFLSDSVVPKKFTQRKVPKRLDGNPQEKAKYNISCFLVDYGKDNQQHFQSVNVSSEEHYNTNEYLQAQSDLLDRGSHVKRFYKGIDIFNQYQIRSYKASVKGLGNMQIQPMCYFQLNIPIFQGVYLITKVSHQMVPNSVETSFEGYRMPSYGYPIVSDVTSYINLQGDLFDLVPENTLTSVATQEDSDGQDRVFSTLPSDIEALANASDNVLFEITIT